MMRLPSVESYVSELPCSQSLAWEASVMGQQAPVWVLEQGWDFSPRMAVRLTGSQSNAFHVQTTFQLVSITRTSSPMMSTGFCGVPPCSFVYSASLCAITAV